MFLRQAGQEDHSPSMGEGYRSLVRQHLAKVGWG